MLVLQAQQILCSHYQTCAVPVVTFGYIPRRESGPMFTKCFENEDQDQAQILTRLIIERICIV